MSFLDRFLGKICTIITVPVNRDFFQEAQVISKPQLYPINLLDHFMGRLIEVDLKYLVIEHPELGTKTLFRMEHVVSIVEEQVLDPNNPEHAKAIKEYKEYKNQETNEYLPGSPPEDDPNKVPCPSCKNRLRVPAGIESGTLVKCPVCSKEFTITKNSSNLIDINNLKKLAEEAKKSTNH
jgi:hypothetical protein